MEVRPGYKQTEIGVIPEDWSVMPLGDCARFRTGPFGSALHKSDYTADGVPVVNPMHIGPDGLEPTRAMTVTEQAAITLADFRLRPGDIVLGRRGDMGRCALVQAEHAGWLCGTGSMIVRCGATADAAFMRRVLSSPRAIAALEEGSVGTTMVNLNQGSLSRLLVQCPPRLEQSAIAEALGDVDALLAGLDRLIAKKRDLKQAAMQQLLTGQTRLPGFEAPWAIRALGDLFDFTGGLSASRDQLSAKGHCYLHYGDIHKSRKSFIDATREYDSIPKLDVPLSQVSAGALLADGDVVFVDASEDDEGASKHVVVVNKDRVPFICGLHTIVAKSKTAELTHEYRRHCFHTAAIRKQFLFYAVGTKVSGISKTNIARLTMPVPEAREQRAIAEALSDMDAELTALEARRQKTRALKQAMMQELLTGRIRLVARCREAGLPEPRFEVRDGFVLTLGREPGRAIEAVTPEVTTEVTTEVSVLAALRGEMSRKELRDALGLRNDEHFRKAYLVPALEAGLVEMTRPDRPTSRAQKYRLTEKGRAVLAAARKREPSS